MKVFIALFICTVSLACHRSSNDDKSEQWEHLTNMKEYQLTNGRKGHFLNQRQCFSPNDNWIVYDTRNDDAHIGQTGGIELLNVATKETQVIYEVENQTAYGPGVGAASFNPAKNQVLFIHGLLNCDSIKPYEATRRTGVLIDVKHPGRPVFMDARDILPPFTPGALRGGTHAYSWTRDGRWVSFTYNDAIISGLAMQRAPVSDLRTVGVMAPSGPVPIEKDDQGENISGEMFSVVVARVTDDPDPGSDEIDKAYEECWIGTEGYKHPNGSRQLRALAFLGDVRDSSGGTVTEVFVADIPADITQSLPGMPIEGTVASRPAPAAGITQRRLTFTAEAPYPGIQGPRHWLRSLPDGSLILFLMKDKKGLVQIFGVPPEGGEIKQITRNDFSVETSFDVSPDGRHLAYGNGQNVYVSDVYNGATAQVSPSASGSAESLQAINWSNNGEMLAYNRKINMGDSAYYQIFLLK